MAFNLIMDLIKLTDDEKDEAKSFLNNESTSYPELAKAYESRIKKWLEAANSSVL